MVLSERGRKKVRVGTVMGDKMSKTVVVAVWTTKLHPRYKKYIRRRRNFKAHDEHETCQVGDKVEIIETRPVSKTKHWRVRRVFEYAGRAVGKV